MTVDEYWEAEVTADDAPGDASASRAMRTAWDALSDEGRRLIVCQSPSMHDLARAEARARIAARREGLWITVAQVSARVAQIREIREHLEDSERAHVLEDRLRRDVLRAIAGGHEDAPALAAAALASEGLGFSRWCA